MSVVVEQCQTAGGVRPEPAEVVQERRRQRAVAHRGLLPERVGLASWDGIRPLAASTLARDDDPEVRRALSANPALSSYVLELLAYDHDRQVRDTVAGREFDEVVVETLIHDGRALEALARNTTLTAPQLGWILEHGGDRTAFVVASSPEATPELLDLVVRSWALMDHSVAYRVELALAGNPAAVPGPSWPLALVRSDDRTTERFLSAMARSLDRTTLEVLMEGWEGTTEELVVAARTLGPEADEAGPGGSCAG